MWEAALWNKLQPVQRKKKNREYAHDTCVHKDRVPCFFAILTCALDREVLR